MTRAICSDCHDFLFHPDLPGVLSRQGVTCHGGVLLLHSAGDKWTWLMSKIKCRFGLQTQVAKDMTVKGLFQQIGELIGMKVTATTS